MIGRILIAAMSMCIAACASSGPEAPDTAEPVAAAAVAPDESLAAATDEITDADTPDAEAVANSEAADYDPNERVCRRERKTGSNLSRKVCYTRAELEARAEADQAALTQMRNQRSGGAQDTNPGGG
jgi:hypothetical protein